jgi:Flp pilus assembly protein TadB
MQNRPNRPVQDQMQAWRQRQMRGAWRRMRYLPKGKERRGYAFAVLLGVACLVAIPVGVLMSNLLISAAAIVLLIVLNVIWP